MSKKVINQNANYVTTLLNSTGSNFVFNESPINRLKNTNIDVVENNNHKKLFKEKELALLMKQINSIEDCNLKNLILKMA
ncbi:hypothetical protein N9J95_01250 [Candidatus Pelagibacter sp.]|nr:hypothetical protein [Candidatus Pelagibacter sp.]